MQIVMEEINRLNRFIEELLFLCRAEADAVTLDKRPQDPGVFLDGFFQDAQVLADSRGVKLAASRHGAGLVAFALAKGSESLRPEAAPATGAGMIGRFGMWLKENL